MKKTPAEREAEKKELKAKIKKWPARLKKLANRKEDPLSERAFCLRHNLPVFGFNRAKNGQEEPRAKKVATIEAAFEAEGV